MFLKREIVGLDIILHLHLHLELLLTPSRSLQDNAHLVYITGSSLWMKVPSNFQSTVTPASLRECSLVDQHLFSPKLKHTMWTFEGPYNLCVQIWAQLMIYEPMKDLITSVCSSSLAHNIPSFKSSQLLHDSLTDLRISARSSSSFALLDFSITLITITRPIERHHNPSVQFKLIRTTRLFSNSSNYYTTHRRTLKS